jgi:3-polyprenyl-4-hydroxybenzoate decarboxylase
MSGIQQYADQLVNANRIIIIACGTSWHAGLVAEYIFEEVTRIPVEVEYAVSTRCQADKDLIIIQNAKGSSLDPSSDQVNLLTTKLGIDATATLLKVKERFEIAKIPGEENLKLSDYLSEQFSKNFDKIY